MICEEFAGGMRGVCGEMRDWILSLSQNRNILYARSLRGKARTAITILANRNRRQCNVYSGHGKGFGRD